MRSSVQEGSFDHAGYDPGKYRRDIVAEVRKRLGINEYFPSSRELTRSIDEARARASEITKKCYVECRDMSANEDRNYKKLLDEIESLSLDYRKAIEIESAEKGPPFPQAQPNNDRSSF